MYKGYPTASMSCNTNEPQSFDSFATFYLVVVNRRKMELNPYITTFIHTHTRAASIVTPSKLHLYNFMDFKLEQLDYQKEWRVKLKIIIFCF